MELTPRLLTEVEFREQWRGYSPNDVDEFLERVASAVGDLQERLREADERANEAERKLVERASAEGEIQQALLLAQRAASSAVAEAEAEAARIVAEAEQRAAAKTEELTKALDELSARLAERRRAYRAELEHELAFVSGEAEPTEAATPEPEPAADHFEEEVAQAREELVEALRRAGVEQLLETASEADEPVPEPDPVTIGEPDDDPFLAELRLAVTDEEPLGPRDSGPHEGTADEPFPTSRFRLRRGR
jgi:cell division initiation protein